MKFDFSRLEDLRRMRELQEHRNIDWQEIADTADIGIRALIRYRRNDVKSPHFRVVLALCAYFKVTPDYFEVKEADAVAQQ